MLVDFRPRLPCAERFYEFSALLLANTQAALSGRNARRRRSRRLSASVFEASRITKRRRKRFAELSRGSAAISCGALGESEVAHFDETCAFVEVKHLASRFAEVTPGLPATRKLAS